MDTKARVLRSLMQKLLTSNSSQQLNNNNYNYHNNSNKNNRNLSKNSTSTTYIQTDRTIQAEISDHHFNLHNHIATCIGILAPLHQQCSDLPLHTTLTFNQCEDGDGGGGNVSQSSNNGDLHQHIVDTIVQYLTRYLLDAEYVCVHCLSALLQFLCFFGCLLYWTLFSLISLNYN